MKHVNEIRGSFLVMRTADIKAFVAAHPEVNDETLILLGTIGRLCNKGAELAGREKLEGLFVEEGHECFPWVALMMGLEKAIEDKATKNKKEYKEPTKEELNTLQKEFDRVMDNMRGGK